MTSRAGQDECFWIMVAMDGNRQPMLIALPALAASVAAEYPPRFVEDERVRILYYKHGISSELGTLAP